METEKLVADYLNFCLIDHDPQWLKQKTHRMGRIQHKLPNTIEEITPAVISSFIVERKKESSPRTVNLDISILKSMFRYGYEMGFIAHNPMKMVKRLRVDEGPVEIYTRDEIMRMITISKGNNKDYLLVLKNTLARVNEVNNLKWGDVFFNTKTIYLGKNGSNTKPRRSMPMNSELYEILFKRYEERDPRDGDYVFGFTDKRRMLKSVCRKLGLPYKGFHAIRKGMATYLVQKRVHLKHIADILGHKSLQYTRFYLRKDEEAIEEILEEL